MNKGEVEKRRPQQNEDREATERKPQDIAPGKVTRTSQLTPPSRAAQGNTSARRTQAHVPQAHDEAAASARAERAALTDRWLDTAFRPDIYPPPEAAGAPLHDAPRLERRAGVMGARAARGQREYDSSESVGMNHASPAAAPMSTSSSSLQAVQATPAADDEPLRENAEKGAAALLEAIDGLGTDEQTVYRVLNQPPEMVQAVHAIYSARHGRDLIEDLRAEFDHLGSRSDWPFVVAQLTRAGIPIPDAGVPYHRRDPAASPEGGARIVASPDVRVAVPGTRITYRFAHGSQGLHQPGTRYAYQWYVLNDPEASRQFGISTRIKGGNRPEVATIARFIGNHKVICEVTRRPRGIPTFYEFPQTVVPEGPLAQDALKQAPELVDPARELEVLETFLQVLRDAEKQPGSSPLDPRTATAYEQQIAALRKRLASTEGAERIPIRAVHVEREKAQVSPLRAFVARIQTKGSDRGGQETWRLVDITNPESRRLSGEYEGSGKDARAAIFAALAAWDQGNRYPTGRIRLELGAEAVGETITHEFQTDGMSFWDSISEFFGQVGFWTGMGALSAGVVSAVAPVPGMRIVSGLVWASILASSASATINIAQRHAEGTASARDDAMDVLTIAGNILAGVWVRGARVLVNGQGGTKIGTGLLIGQIGTDGAQGIVLSLEYLEHYERVMAIEEPKQRSDALMELLRSAALVGGMLFISVQGTRSDLGRLGTPGHQGGLTRPGNPGETIDPNAPTSEARRHDSLFEAGQISQPRKTPHKENTSETPDLALLQQNLEAARIPPADAEVAIAMLRGAGISASAASGLSSTQLQKLVRLGRVDGTIGVTWLKKHGLAGLDAVERIEMAVAKKLHTKLRNKGIEDDFAIELMGWNEPSVLERLVTNNKVLQDLAHSPRRDAIVDEADAMLAMQGYDVPYTLPPSTPGGSGSSNSGHSYERHGAHTKDADQFMRAKKDGFPMSRWDSFQNMQKHIDAAIAKVYDPTTPQGSTSPINAKGWKQIKSGKMTVNAILGAPLAHMQYLKKKIQIEKVDAGTRIGTEFDPDGVSVRSVNHYTVVLQLDDTGTYRLLTSFPDRP